MAGSGSYGVDDGLVGFIVGVKGWFFFRGVGIIFVGVFGGRKEKSEGVVVLEFLDLSCEVILEGSFIE